MEQSNKNNFGKRCQKNIKKQFFTAEEVVKKYVKGDVEPLFNYVDSIRNKTLLHICDCYLAYLNHASLKHFHCNISKGWQSPEFIKGAVKCDLRTAYDYHKCIMLITAINGRLEKELDKIIFFGALYQNADSEELRAEVRNSFFRKIKEESDGGNQNDNKNA